MSLTQDLSWSLGRSIALQLQRQTDNNNIYLNYLQNKRFRTRKKLTEMYKTTWCKQLRMIEWAKENPKHKVLTYPLHEIFEQGCSFGTTQNKRENHRPQNEHPWSNNVKQKAKLKA